MIGSSYDARVYKLLVSLLAHLFQYSEIPIK